MNKIFPYRRFLEVIPGGISWGLIVTLVLLAFFKPVACAIIIIIFDFYWIIRSTYLTMLLVLARHRLAREKDKDWLRACQGLKPQGRWDVSYFQSCYLFRQ